MSSYPIELGLNRGVSPDAVLQLTDRLLVLMSTLAPDYPSLDSGHFRAAVDGWRNALRNQPLASPDVTTLLTRVVSGCETYFGRVRVFQGERESEFVEIVGVLRDVLGTLRGGADTFDQSFEQRAMHLERLSSIEDVRELRRAVATEVDGLRRLVADRKQQDQAAFRSLSKRVESLEASLKEAQEEASIDGLTKLANRRTFDRALARCVARAQRGDFRFVLALIDIDDFKKINDSHGHQVGDRVLVCMAQVLNTFVRSNDFVARYGGEEFAMILEQTTVAQARARLTSLLNCTSRAYEYERESTPVTLRFTFSIGATEFEKGDMGEDVIRRSDEALYSAKRKGKCRVEFAATTMLQRLLG